MSSARVDLYLNEGQLFALVKLRSVHSKLPLPARWNDFISRVGTKAAGAANSRRPHGAAPRPPSSTSGSTFRCNRFYDAEMGGSADQPRVVNSR